MRRAPRRPLSPPLTAAAVLAANICHPGCLRRPCHRNDRVTAMLTLMLTTAASKFSADNYGTTTTSCIEYHFVMYGGEGIVTLEEHYKGKLECMPPDDKDKRTYPQELRGVEKGELRVPCSFTEMETKLMEKNDELTHQGYEPIGKEEFVCARMYTGPVRRHERGPSGTFARCTLWWRSH